MRDDKKVSKLFSKIGLEPDEQVIVGFETHAKEAVLRRESAPADATSEAEEPIAPMSSSFSDGKLLLVLTSDRIFTAEMSWSGSPSKISTEWDRSDVRKVAVNDADPRQLLVIAFVDGSAVAVAGASGSDSAGFAHAWAADEAQRLAVPAQTDTWEPLQVSI